MNAAAKKSAPVLADAQLLELSPSDILIPERIGFLHEDKAAALGRLMAVDGQRDPIKIVRYLPSKSIEQCVSEGKPPWRLVTGMHRLMGATYEGITIFAIEVSGKAEDLADLEASENLHRRPLGPIERAKFTAALVRAAQERIAREHGELSHQKLGAKVRWERVKRQEIGAEEALTVLAERPADGPGLLRGTACRYAPLEFAAPESQLGLLLPVVARHLRPGGLLCALDPTAQPVATADAAQIGSSPAS